LFHFVLRNKFASEPAVPIFNCFAIVFKVIVVSCRKRRASFTSITAPLAVAPVLPPRHISS